jgi:hypothetical protein
MKINRKDITYGIVAFIDVIGFSRQVETSKSLSDITKIIQQIQSLRNEFQEESEVKELFKKEVIAFTDCMIISVAAKSKIAQIEGTYDTWLNELFFITMCQVNIVMNKNIFIRGGISDGWWYHKDNVIISPAQIESYKLESQKAEYPIIALSSHLVEYLTNPDNYKVYSCNPTEDLLIKDKEKNIWFIDYLGCCIESLDWIANKDILKRYIECRDNDKKKKLITKGWKLKVQSALKRHKEVILNAYNSSSNDKIKKKYRWLANYHNTVIDRYHDNFKKYKLTI